MSQLQFWGPHIVKIAGSWVQHQRKLCKVCSTLTRCCTRQCSSVFLIPRMKNDAEATSVRLYTNKSKGQAKHVLVRWRIKSMVLFDHQLWIPRKAALGNTPFQDVVICGKAADAEQGKACKNEERHLLWFSFGRFTAAQAAPEGQEIQTTETSLHLLWSCKGNVSFHGAHNFTDFESDSFIMFHAQSKSKSISYDISDTFWHWGGKKGGNWQNPSRHVGNAASQSS